MRLNECVCLLGFIAAELPATRSLTWESGIKLEEWTVLTGLLNRGRAFSKHAQGCVDYLPVELPRSTVVSKCNVLPISSQNICSYLHHKHDMNGNHKRSKQNRTFRGELYLQFEVFLQTSFPSWARLLWRAHAGWWQSRCGSPSSASMYVRILPAVLWKAHAVVIHSAGSAGCQSAVVQGGVAAPWNRVLTSWTWTAALTKWGPPPWTHTDTKTKPYQWQRRLVQQSRNIPGNICSRSSDHCGALPLCSNFKARSFNL